MPDHDVSQLAGKLRQLTNTRTSRSPERSLVPVETTRREVRLRQVPNFLPGKERGISRRTAASLGSGADAGLLRPADHTRARAACARFQGRPLPPEPSVLAGRASFRYAGVRALAHSGRIRILVSASITRCGLPRPDQTIRGSRETASVSGHVSRTAREKLAFGISS